MTDKLPPNLLALFQPRPPLRYLPPCDTAPEKRATHHITGVGQYLQALKEYPKEHPYTPTESWLQKKDREKLEKREALEKLLNEDIKTYNPKEDPNIRGDPFKTLFVSRLNYDVEVKDLEREFGRYGPIERIRIVGDTHANESKPLGKKKKKNKGYAFIVYEREKDMRAAYKDADGVRIKDRRVCVDVERGRTVSAWRPRRFGGGLGGRGYTKTTPARPVGPGGFGPPAGPGGFRGGFGGGFRGGRGGGFRGGFGGGDRFRGGPGPRGGVGYHANGAPEGAPSGPRGGRGGHGGYGGRDSHGGGYDKRHDDRGYYGRDRGGPSSSNREPLGERKSYRDRDREGGYGGRDNRDDHPRKRAYDGDGYDDPRSKRRY
ncbi:U1 small nuclear ribonucleoprotein of 70kDa MW N terminal-domain-containing protein [Lineolata rhizophorae]|uniref:U1 small nuclear ribonucleoprotein of 70kDa MW N terminal-domain-containing protein n=1 Tax=Lineolata rhizophorae TaxID=578093 RepID=A0A6A6NPL0_9PEZI|nr:U1 small nuclear ribonucleoprotein of 70kDa MW N terminal-domain-containing protein [Lineolata rhizophorae]